MLLQFLTTSRGDGKRFEMLSIFSSILSWDDSERERAGLQRAGTGANAPPSLGGRRVFSGSKIPDLDKADEPEVRAYSSSLQYSEFNTWAAVLFQNVGGVPSKRVSYGLCPSPIS
jgi:GRAB domain